MPSKTTFHINAPAALLIVNHDDLQDDADFGFEDLPYYETRFLLEGQSPIQYGTRDIDGLTLYTGKTLLDCYREALQDEHSHVDDVWEFEERKDN